MGGDDLFRSAGGACRRLAAMALVVCAGACDRTPADREQTERWLTDVTVSAGLDFTHVTGATGTLALPEIMGGGVGLLDADGDGDLDVYLVSSGSANKLFIQGPDGRFTDATAVSGLGDTGFGMGVAVGDVNDDGAVDVYVTNLGPDVLYLGRGDGTFIDGTAAAGIDVPAWSCSAALFDYDRDGDLDLFVTQYVRFDPDRVCYSKASLADYCGPKVFEPLPDVLLRNDAGGTFTDVSVASGIATRAAAGLGVVCDDFDDDGWPDLYVANDAYANHLWLNRHDGTFEESAVVRGAAYNVLGQAEAGMGVVAADLDGDATIDLFVTHLSRETNTLYRRVDGGFMDVTGTCGLGCDSRPFTGFGVAATDLDADGDLDLLVANGRVNLLEPMRGALQPSPWNQLAEPNLCFLNTGRGRFEPAGDRARAFTAPLEITRGLAVGDLDGDGDEDVVVVNVGGRARLYRNDAPPRGRRLAVRPIDPALRREPIGARVTVTLGQLRLVGTVHQAESYLSSREPVVRFGLGPVERVDCIDVRWPDGAIERFDGTDRLDRTLDLRRGDGRPGEGGRT